MLIINLRECYDKTGQNAANRLEKPYIQNATENPTSK